MVSASDFVNGSDVQWQRLARVLVGATFGAVFTGWASIVLGVADLVIRPLAWLSSFLGRLVEELVGIPARLVEESWDGALGFVLEFGPFAFVAAIAIVLVTLYVAERVVNQA